MVKKLFLLILCGAFLADAQTKVDIQRQGRSTSFLSPPFSTPLRSGESLPLTCTVGELYFLTSALPGANIHVCHAPGEWAPQGSSGQANVTVRNGNDLVGSRSTLNFDAGVGILQIVSDSGSAISIQNAIDAAVVMTKAASQSGTSLLCEASVVESDTYACLMSPTLTAYTPGMLIHWRPSMSPLGQEIQLNIDQLGAKFVRQADGVTNPAVGEIVAGSLYLLWYDGTCFRIASPSPKPFLLQADYRSGAPLRCDATETSPGAFECSMVLPVTSYQRGMVLHFLPDSAVDGPITLNVDTVGAKSVKLADGITDPSPGDLHADQMYPIWYDGTQFRLGIEPRPANDTSPRPACTESLRGTRWLLYGETGVKDQFAICVKDELDSYAWHSLY